MFVVLSVFCPPPAETAGNLNLRARTLHLHYLPFLRLQLRKTLKETYPRTLHMRSAAFLAFLAPKTQMVAYLHSKSAKLPHFRVLAFLEPKKENEGSPTRE